MATMRETKMLQKEASRPSKPGIVKLKKPRKSLVGVFDSVTDEIFPAKSMESESFSSNYVAREAGSESFSLLDPELSDSPGLSLHSEITCSSEITSVDSVEPDLISPTRCGFDGEGDLKINPVEVQIAVSALRKAASNVLNSDSVDPRSKKILYMLVKMEIENLETVPEEKDRISEILAMKTRIVSGFFLCCVIATLVVRFLLSLESRNSYGRPTPT